MGTILLIRHGQASYGAADYDRLSPTGVEQARLVADRLAAHRIEPKRIISGSLLRQIDTAAPAAARFAVGAEVDPRWNEYDMDDIIAAHPDPQTPAPTRQSEVSSSVFQDILEGALEAWMAAGADSSAGETWPALHARVIAGLDQLAEGLRSGETALVFTSGGVIATVCAELLELPAPQLVLLNRVAVNTGITKLAVGRRGVSLIAFNDHAHLEGTGLITYR